MKTPNQVINDLSLEELTLLIRRKASDYNIASRLSDKVTLQLFKVTKQVEQAIVKSM